MRVSERNRGWLMAMSGAALWGGTGVSAQYILQACHFEPGWLVVVRMLVSGLCLLLLELARGNRSFTALWRSREDALDLVAFALVGMVGVQYSFFACVQLSNAAAATVLEYLMPVIVVAWTAMRSRRWPRSVELVALLGAVGGTFCLVTHGDLGRLSIAPDAFAWGLLSAVAAAFYTVQPKRLIGKWGADLVLGWGLLLGGALLALAFPPWRFRGLWTTPAAINLAVVVFLGTLLTFRLYIGSLKYIPPSEVSVIGTVEPLSAIVFTVTVMGVPFAAWDWLGSALILAAVLLLARSH